MKTITIIAERMTDQALTAVVPPSGLASLHVSPSLTDVRDKAAIQGYQSFRNPSRFNPAVRIDLLVEDNAVDTVFDAVSFAYAAGIFSDAEMWVEAPALALSA
jgi:nitrogen regulatory protein PII